MKMTTKPFFSSFFINLESQIMILVVLTALFFLGFWGVDVSLTTAMSGGVMQSLFFSSVEPRVSYHASLMLMAASFMTITSLYVKERFKKVKE